MRKLALLGNYAPRQCGIATFTTDLATAVTTERPDVDCFVVAMNDGARRHAYPGRVRFEIAESDLASYRRAADFVNVQDVDLLCVQHEYGIFGGKAGAHVLTMLREVRAPIVTTLHTVLAEPDALQRDVMDELVAMSERVVVMSAHGAYLLKKVHAVPESKIALIPHGAPTLPPAPMSKEHLGLKSKSVILTFGLLSPDKGIEYVIDAMPAILARQPQTVYIIVGATHPHVKEQQGETYRLMLVRRAERLGVAASTVFHNRFVRQEELVEFLAAADLYVTPYLNPEQITSGTLAYAIGCGKAVISTPYQYARELLGEGRGVLVPPRDSAAIARAAVDLLCDEPKRRSLSERAAARGPDMTWPAVARGYWRVFEQASASCAARLRTRSFAEPSGAWPAELPETNIGHLRILTDDTGVLQHATFDVPRYADGYCLDDNARALLAMAYVESAGTVDDASAIRMLASRYLAFVSAAFDRPSGRFRNFMTYERAWVEGPGSDDSHGRAIWALGAVVRRSREPGRQSLSGSLFDAALPAVERMSSPRAWAFALLGIDEYLHAFEGDSRVQQVRAAAASRLFDLFERSSTGDWPWFEDNLTYCNARLPHALIASGARMGRQDMVAAGLRSLEWLASVQETPEGYFSPIGSNGFYARGGPRARFDQQPIEASSMISASLEAARVSGNPKWDLRAMRAFEWYLGQNHLQRPLYVAATGGCRDGLHADRLNENQGAESTLSFLQALTEMHLAHRGRSAARSPPRMVE